MPKALLIDHRTTSASVPKEYVHLHEESAILATEWSELGPDRYGVSVRWPEEGLFGGKAPLLVPQTIRQSCLLIGHAERSVPLSHQTLMERMDYTLDGAFFGSKNKPDNLFVTLACRSRGPRSMHIELSLLSEGRPVGEALVDFSWINPAVYRRLRGAYANVGWGRALVPAPVPAGLVGQTRDPDVVLAPSDTPYRWQLRMDVGNTALYDHPVDHVPGLALIEAAYQAAYAVTGPGATPIRVTSGFERYIEFDTPCWIDATVAPVSPDGTVRVEVTGTQQGQKAFVVTLDCATTRI